MLFHDQLTLSLGAHSMNRGIHGRSAAGFVPLVLSLRDRTHGYKRPLRTFEFSTLTDDPQRLHVAAEVRRGKPWGGNNLVLHIQRGCDANARRAFSMRVVRSAPAPFLSRSRSLRMARPQSDDARTIFIRPGPIAATGSPGTTEAAHRAAGPSGPRAATISRCLVPGSMILIWYRPKAGHAPSFPTRRKRSRPAE